MLALMRRPVGSRSGNVATSLGSGMFGRGRSNRSNSTIGPLPGGVARSDVGIVSTPHAPAHAVRDTASRPTRSDGIHGEHFPPGPVRARVSNSATPAGRMSSLSGGQDAADGLARVAQARHALAQRGEVESSRRAWRRRRAVTSRPRSGRVDPRRRGAAARRTSRAVRARPTTSSGMPCRPRCGRCSSTSTRAGTPLRSATLSTRNCRASVRVRTRFTRRSIHVGDRAPPPARWPNLSSQSFRCALGRRDAVTGDRPTASRRARARALKEICDVVEDLPPVQHTCRLHGPAGEGLEEHRRELDVPCRRSWRRREVDLPHEVRAARKIERAGGPRLVHRQGGPAVAGDPGLVPERLGDALAEDQPQVLRRVVAVDFHVARGLDVRSSRPWRAICSTMCAGTGRGVSTSRGPCRRGRPSPRRSSPWSFA